MIGMNQTMDNDEYGAGDGMALRLVRISGHGATLEAKINSYLVRNATRSTPLLAESGENAATVFRIQNGYTVMKRYEGDDIMLLIKSGDDSVEKEISAMSMEGTVNATITVDRRPSLLDAIHGTGIESSPEKVAMLRELMSLHEAYPAVMQEGAYVRQ
jgi:hypothetical protein